MSDEEEFDETMEENSDEESEEESGEESDEESDEEKDEAPEEAPPVPLPPVRISGLQRLNQIQSSLNNVSSTISYLRARSGWKTNFSFKKPTHSRSVQFGPSLCDSQMKPSKVDKALSKTSLASFNRMNFTKENKNVQTDVERVDKKLSVPRFNEDLFRKSVNCQTSFNALLLRGRTIEEEINRRTFDQQRMGEKKGRRDVPRNFGYQPGKGRVKISDKRIDELYLQRNRNSHW